MVVHTLSFETGSTVRQIPPMARGTDYAVTEITPSHEPTAVEVHATQDDIDEAIELMNAQIRIALRRGIGAFLLENQHQPLAMQVVSEASGGYFLRQIRDAVTDDAGAQTLHALVHHQEPPILVAHVANLVKHKLMKRLGELLQPVTVPSNGDVVLVSA